MTRSGYGGRNRWYFSGHHCCFTYKVGLKINNSCNRINWPPCILIACRVASVSNFPRKWGKSEKETVGIRRIHNTGYAAAPLVKEAQIRLLLSPCWDWVNLSSDARVCCQLLQGTMATCTRTAGAHREYPLHWHFNINFQGRTCLKTTNAFQMLCFWSGSNPRPNWITKWNATDRARLSEKKA